MARNKGENRTIAIARFSAIGDVAMAVPVVYNICRKHPDTQFIFLTRKNLTPLFVNRPDNLVVEGVDLSSNRYKGIPGLWRLTSEMVGKYHFDTFVDIHDVIRTRIIGLFCRLRGVCVIRFDKGRREKRALTRKHNKSARQLPSQAERYARAIMAAIDSESIASDPSSDFNGLFNGHSKADTAQFSKIASPKPAGTKWVAVAPFAAHKGKIYPPDLMHKVVKAIAGLPNTHVFLLGGGGEEREILESWAKESDNITSIAGKRYGFGAELALLNHCDAALTMDSANMHLAALAQTPAVSVWGATHPSAGFAGWGQNPDNFVQLALSCRPCSIFGNKPCINPDRKPDTAPPCLVSIPPEAIVRKLAALINT